MGELKMVAGEARQQQCAGSRTVGRAAHWI